ncbi:nucleoside-diphosphate kinase [Kutzneria buriramensis]|uniref:Nucleoside diphosphate kinase n=1 Tax=Kutzneria buriramensis TaxID=1045776 RepID=A0A3E0H0C0_9PSEU|nr:nucleoside-diphosphate kinase [Kutzneria buriramensis]REH34870.1 nucleoside diphosphate kinase [Kutzneria buriramensis]
MTDVYLDDCVAQLDRLGVDPAAFAHEHGLLLLKPDAVVARRLLPAVDWLSRHGFRIVAAERISLGRHAIRAVWQEPWRSATWQRRRIADLLATATDSLVLLVRREVTGRAPVCVRLTAMKGAGDPLRREQGQLRHALGAHGFLLNMAHTADEPVDVLRELAIYFDTDHLFRTLRGTLAGADRSARARQLARELCARFPPQCLDLAERAASLLREVDRLLVDDAISTAARAGLRAAVGPPDADLRAALAGILLWAWQWGVRLDPWNVIVVGAAVLPLTSETTDTRRGVACTG